MENRVAKKKKVRNEVEEDCLSNQSSFSTSQIQLKKKEWRCKERREREKTERNERNSLGEYGKQEREKKISLETRFGIQVLIQVIFFSFLTIYSFLLLFFFFFSFLSSFNLKRRSTNGTRDINLDDSRTILEYLFYMTSFISLVPLSTILVSFSLYFLSLFLFYH